MFKTKTDVIVVQICASCVFLSSHEIGYKSRYGPDWKVPVVADPKYNKPQRGILPAVLEAIHLSVTSTRISYIKLV